MTLNAKRIGLFGGSFDPVHNGHLALANYIVEHSLVDEVVFIPVGNPWQKSKPIASGLARKAMLELAIGVNPKFSVSAQEIDRAGVSYTIDTVREFKVKDQLSNFYLLLGVDAASSIPTWHQATELISLVNFLVVAREKETAPKFDFDFQFVNMPLVDISSTKVRNLIAQGLPISHLVPKVVADYIFDHNLYKNSGMR